jgi:hypothetical protein
LQTSACLSKRTAATILHIRAHQSYGRMVLELLLDLTRRQIWRATGFERRCCDLKHLHPKAANACSWRLVAAWGVAVIATNGLWR